MRGCYAIKRADDLVNPGPRVDHSTLFLATRANRVPKDARWTETPAPIPELAPVIRRTLPVRELSLPRNSDDIFREKIKFSISDHQQLKFPNLPLYRQSSQYMTRQFPLCNTVQWETVIGSIRSLWSTTRVV